MNEQIFKEIARELKTLHNTAVELIKVGKLDEAKKMYERAAGISEMTGYSEGVGMSMFSISNLELLRGDYTRALDYALVSGDYYTDESDKKRALELTARLSLHLVKKGIEMEASGEIEEALNLFSKALPHLKGKKRDAVLYEMDLLRRITGHE